ncbi:hypothetical protein QYE76_057679 [Lolium multiflorum]|uniref:Acidic endochitinase n=1 Tax=Lolium multiflorum TaxID=4521 RepID=A0AAD8WRN0_LOLMU|nr:hypothetical protein QYE76_000036 [Lolium multiflorum]KAK1669520.1 hypothetical protein QYE76_057679 [Lolium multiflorum]
MASRGFTTFQLTAFLLVALLATCHAGSIAIYWGQNDGEASLAETCASGNYEFVILAFLPKFGKGQTPQLDLASHCDPSSSGCRSQSKGHQLLPEPWRESSPFHRRCGWKLWPLLPR